jgi:LemA protein
VNQYNSFIRTFPYNLTAKLFGYGKPRPYFEAQPGAEAPPKVYFN